MSLNQDQLAEHCDVILKSKRIKNKIVILCEGKRSTLQGRPSPQTYGKMEQMPDANFYKACVPRSWRNSRPDFFNCGDRDDVINTYFALHEYHQADPVNSFLSPDKLFALIDLDLHNKKIKYEYDFQDTENIFLDLYCKGCIQEANVSRHRIWITGLIYKEAYFLFPDLQTSFSESFLKPTYKSQPVVLRDLYCDMADAIPGNGDICNNLETVQNRLNHCAELEFSNPEAHRQSWTQSFRAASDENQRHRLTTALLTIKPVKPFWNSIQPPPDWTSSDRQFREQLSLEIGREFYANQTDAQRYHLVAFFKTLQTYL
jgi:hypothetical protein